MIVIDRPGNRAFPEAELPERDADVACAPVALNDCKLCNSVREIAFNQPVADLQWVRAAPGLVRSSAA
jgi:hypothetical protein